LLRPGCALVNLFLQFRQCGRDFPRVHRLHAPACFFEIDDRRGKRQQRLDLGKLPRLKVQLPQLVFEMVLEKQVIDLSVLAHRIELHRLERRQPLFVKHLKARAPRPRDRHLIRTRQTAAVSRVTLDRRPHLADIFSLSDDVLGRNLSNETAK
jgi:hypothetical protein